MSGLADPPPAEDLTAFREEVRAWLAAHHDDAPRDPVEVDGAVAAHRRWEAQLHAAGYCGIDWPRAHGGQGRSHAAAAAFDDEYDLAGFPERLSTVALHIVGPTLLDCATEEQRARWLPPLLPSEEIWALALSEPEAGSDLTALTTRAQVSGEGLRITGRKIWSSLAPVADWLLCLVRTDPSGRGRHGLSVVAVRADAPGVRIEPIRQIHGGIGFAEITFDDAPASRQDVIGEIDDGWAVMTALFRHERGTVMSPGRFDRVVAALRAALSGQDRPALRERLNQLAVRARQYRLHTELVLAAPADPTFRGPGALRSSTAVTSARKLFWSRLAADLFDLAAEVVAGGVGDEWDDPFLTGALSMDGARWWNEYWQARAAAIYGGASEIQKDLVARDLLGRPGH